jgi:hypothetical protein
MQAEDVDALEMAFRSGITFLVGSGISVPPPSLLPDFERLSRDVLRTLLKPLLETDRVPLDCCERLAKVLRPEVIYQVAMEELTNGQTVLQSLAILNTGQPNNYHFFLAEALKRGNCVFTTNADCMIEKACEILGISIQICSTFPPNDMPPHCMDFHSAINMLDAGQPVKSCLFKLHGTIEDNITDPYRTIQFAIRQVGRGLYDAATRTLTHFLKESPFCVLGYSCRDDFSVFPVIQSVSTDQPIFWFSYTTHNESISRASNLRGELDTEERKSLSTPRNWELHNTNKFLLNSFKSSKYYGDPLPFIESFASRLNIVLPVVNGSRIAPADRGFTLFSEWASMISILDRSIFAGTLFEQATQWTEAKKAYLHACDIASEPEDILRTKRTLANLEYQRGSDGEANALQLYNDCMNLTADPIQRANLLVSISNVLRRKGAQHFDDAYRCVEDAKHIYDSLSEEQRDKNALGYARCLNVYGLACYSKGRKDPTFLHDAQQWIETSHSIKRDNGDIDGMAESENAIALVLTERSKREVGTAKDELLSSAVKSAEQSADKRLRIGNYRKCAAPFRNLAYPQSELMKSAANNESRHYWFSRAESNYIRAIEALQHVQPTVPVGDFAHLTTTLAKLYAEYSTCLSDASEVNDYSSKALNTITGLLRDPDCTREIRKDRRLTDMLKDIVSKAHSGTLATEVKGLIDSLYHDPS